MNDVSKPQKLRWKLDTSISIDLDNTSQTMYRNELPKYGLITEFPYVLGNLTIKKGAVYYWFNNVPWRGLNLHIYKDNIYLETILDNNEVILNYYDGKAMVMMLDIPMCKHYGQLNPHNTQV